MIGLYTSQVVDRWDWKEYIENIKAMSIVRKSTWYANILQCFVVDHVIM